MKKAIKISFSMLALLSLALCLSSCKIVEDKVLEILEEKALTHTELCENIIDSFIESSSVSTMLPDGFSEGDISEINDELSLALNNASSYKLKPVGWHMNSVNGYSTDTVTFELSPDNGRLASVTIVLESGTSNIIGFDANDVTDFAAKETTYKLVNVGLKAVSIVFVAFAAWMLIDCVKRNIKLKPLWIFIIIAGIMISLSLGKTGLNYNASVGIILALSDFDYSVLSENISIRVLLPIGAAVYFFIRKKLPLSAPACEEQTLDINQLLNEDTPQNDTKTNINE